MSGLLKGVEELLGDGPQTSMEGVENISDALRLNFKDDRNVAVVYKGEEIGTFRGQLQWATV